MYYHIITSISIDVINKNLLGFSKITNVKGSETKVWEELVHRERKEREKK